jgi:hypothetical protein
MVGRGAGVIGESGASGIGGSGTKPEPVPRDAPWTGSAAARAAHSRKLRQDGNAAERQNDSWYVRARGSGDDSA